MKLLDGAEVARRLDLDGVRGAVRAAMIALSEGATMQLPRGTIQLGADRLFGTMTGTLANGSFFGAKIVSVFTRSGGGHSTHQGSVILFDGVSGLPICIADAAAITELRTAAATAAATDSLARVDADILTIVGTGCQASAHIDAVARVRRLSKINIWGRSHEHARELAERKADRTEVRVEAVTDLRAAVAEAAIICTVTGSKQPLISGSWITPGAHVNLIGSSDPSAAEVDGALLQRGRYFVESRDSAVIGASEYLNARKQGLVSEQDIVAEIGEVFGGKLVGRRSDDEITIYKSIGHIVQDLAACHYALGNDLATNTSPSSAPMTREKGLIR